MQPAPYTQWDPDGTLKIFRHSRPNNQGLACGPQTEQQIETSCASGPSSLLGNPIQCTTGIKLQSEIDYRSPGPDALGFSRTYSFQPAKGSSLANGQWDATPGLRLSFKSLLGFDLAIVENGSRLRRVFVKNGTAWLGSPGSRYALSADGSGWVFRAPSDEAHRFDSQGQSLGIERVGGRQQTITWTTQGNSSVATVQDRFGRSLQLDYSNGQLIRLTDPATQQIRYEYDASGNLSSVVYPDDTPENLSDNPRKQYLYEDTRFLHALTGIVDENGARYATYAYDAQGRAILSEHADGAGKLTLEYPSDTQTVTRSWTDASRYVEKTYTHHRHDGGDRITRIQTAACVGCGIHEESWTYNAAGDLEQAIDPLGLRTAYAHDSRGRETARTEASASAQERTTTTQWHSDLRLPTQIDESGRRTVYTYDAQGNRTSQVLTDTTTGESRTMTYSYTAQGLLETLDGPRTDVSDITTYGYDAQGNINHISNALGLVTEVTSHDAHGNPLRIVDPNGVETLLTYDVRQRLKSATAGGEVTQYDYDNVGQLTKVTLPDGSFLQYSYDPAHRLTGIQDHQGNRIAYTLDLAGNRTAEEILDASNTLRRRQTRVYDALSRLQELRGASGQVTGYGYDANGNLTQTTDPLSQVTGQSYDALNRLTQVTDATNGITRYEYNALDQLTAVTDPRGLVTRYTVNAFGEVTRLESPDTSITASTYDAAGNLKTRTDAKNQATAYDYDALNRLTQITYVDDSTVTYSYDQGTHGTGRLTGMTDASGSTAWTYDLRGRVIQKTQTVGSKTLTNKYAYNGAGQLIRTTLPSGRVVRHEWAGGKVINLYVDNGPITGARVVSQITHHAFGPPATWQFGNGEVTERSYDLDGRLTAHALGTLGYDDASRVVSLAQSNRSALNGSKTYGYDALDRLTGYQDAASSIVYSYDATGNRTQQVGAGTNVSYGIEPSSNRISQVDTGSATASYEYDANGSLTDDGVHVYAYDAAGRLRSTETGTYSYNGLGQRVQKVVNNPVSGGLDGLPVLQQTLSTTTLFAYDEAGHLIGEYDGDGNLIQETLWLGDLPMVVLKPEATYYIHADHLNTPRQIDNSAQQAVWTWDTITFGGNTPSQPAAGAAANFRYNLRFPGQYYDGETGLLQNWFRNYNPNLGRYVESDPIGLYGGINTYVYALNSPQRFVDPTGLDVVCMDKIGSYFEKSVRIKTQDRLIVEVNQCYPLLGVGPDIPEPWEPPPSRGRVIRPFGFEIILRCRRTWETTQEEKWETRNELWMHSWVECTDTCTGKKTNLWKPDQKVRDLP